MKRIHELEDKIAQQKTECSSLQTDHDNILKEFGMKDQSQNIELLTLTKACEMQKEDIEILTRENVEYQKYNKELIEKHKEDMLQLEGELNDERTSLKEKLHEVRGASGNGGTPAHRRRIGRQQVRTRLGA